MNARRLGSLTLLAGALLGLAQPDVPSGRIGAGAEGSAMPNACNVAG